MAKMMTPKELLERQSEKQNPLMATLIATVIKLEEANHAINECNKGEEGEELSPILTSIVKGNTDLIEQMQEASLFMPLVLKLQLPLASNEDTPTALAYNEDRSLEEHLTIDPGVLSYFDEDEFKIFVNARIWVDGTLQLHGRTEDQPW